MEEVKFLKKNFFSEENLTSILVTFLLIIREKNVSNNN